MTHIAAISVIAQTSPVQNSNITDNPLLTESSLPYHVPPFDKIKDEHFVPAIEAGMREQLKEIEAVANNSEKPTFDNTIVALERTGRLLDRAERTFSNLNACNTNPTLQKIEKEMAPKLAAHREQFTSIGNCSRASRSFTTIATTSDSIRNRLICSSAITRISCGRARSSPIPTRKSSKKSMQTPIFNELPATQVNDGAARSPFTLLHGAADRVIPVSVAHDFAAALRQHDWPVQVVELPADHGSIAGAVYDASAGRYRCCDRRQDASRRR